MEQCAYGLKVCDVDGEIRLAKKPTCVRTTKESMYEGLWRECDKCHQHAHLTGSSPEGPRSAQAEDYPRPLADKLEDLVANDTPKDLVFATAEENPPVKETKVRQKMEKNHKKGSRPMLP